MEPQSKRIKTNEEHFILKLIEKYKKEFPADDGESDDEETCGGDTPTPFICACEMGRLDDVKKFVEHYANENNHYINEIGRNSCGDTITALGAALYGEHFNVVSYLLEQRNIDVGASLLCNWLGRK